MPQHNRKRRLLKGRISFISLVPRGANQMTSIFKSEDNDMFSVDPIVKSDIEKGELISLVYVPNHRDSEGDIADAQVIKEMAYDAQKNGGVDIDIRHDEKALSKEQAYVAETFIVQKNDPRFEDVKDYSGNSVDTEGAWAVVIKIQDENLKKLYRDGKWKGVSMGGSGNFKDEIVLKDQDNLSDEEIEAFAKRHNLNITKKEESDDMAELKKEDVVSIITEVLDARDAKIAKSEAETKADKEAEDLKKEKALRKQGFFKPRLTGKWDDEDAIAKFQYHNEIYKEAWETDFTDPESVADFAESVKLIKEQYPEVAEAEEAEKVEKAEKKKTARAKLSKGEKTNKKIEKSASSIELENDFEDFEDDEDIAKEMSDYVNKELYGNEGE